MLAIALEPYNTCICTVCILPFSWFSMKLGVMNSFLIVYFTMVQNWFEKYRILTKISLKGYETIFKTECITFAINTAENIPIIFPQFRLTKPFMIIR